MPRLFERVAASVLPSARLKRALRQAEAGQGREAFPVLARAARAGNALAQYRVGRAYLEGAGVPASRADAAHWLLRSAEAGQVEAQLLLATLHLGGVGGDGAPAALFATAPGPAQPDFERAAHWARRAADAGNAEAQALLGYCLTSGPEAMRDLPQADDLYRKSAAAGCAQGSLGLGLSIMRTAADEDAKLRAAVEIAKAASADLPLGLYL